MDLETYERIADSGTGDGSQVLLIPIRVAGVWVTGVFNFDQSIIKTLEWARGNYEDGRTLEGWDILNARSGIGGGIIMGIT